MVDHSQKLKVFSEQYVQIIEKIRSDYSFPFLVGEFLAHTWKIYDTESNLFALLSSDEPYFAHKEILFLAFCAWLIAPADNEIRKSFIVIAAARKLSQFEDDIIEKDHEARFALEITNRIGKIGPDFFEEIYYPIGGLRALLACPSTKEISKILRRERENVERIVFMAKMLHFAAIEFQNGSLPRPASKNMIVNAVDRLELDKKKKLRGLQARTAGPLWREYEPSMLLLYAAHFVRVSPRPRLKNGSFLDAILSREISFEHDIHLVAEIVARAQYLKSVLSKGIAQETMQILNASRMPNITPIETKINKFDYAGNFIDEAVVKKFLIDKPADQ